LDATSRIEAPPEAVDQDGQCRAFRIDISHHQVVVDDVAAQVRGKFQALARIFFTSDHHFGHGGALGLFKRPFANVEAMNKAMLNAWNAIVGPDDQVYHLGDFALMRDADRVGSLLGALHGEKHLVRGNNDNDDVTSLPEWATVQDYLEMTLDGHRLVLCHYPFRSWNGMHKGAWNLHGHSHGRLKPLRRQVDVGVDVWDFRPVELAGIVARRSRIRT
jgi:calcineurin-like phosphoesterase family protein